MMAEPLPEAQEPSRYPILTIVDEVLHAAGVFGAPSRPNPLPSQPFVVFFRNGGGAPTSVTEEARVELEAWGMTYRGAEDVLSAAEDALHEAVGTHGIREVRTVSDPTDLTTDERGWERFTSAVAITTRPKRRYLR